jgi:hypothetical protein
MPGRCLAPPTGWLCTRIGGHDGPCAALSLRPPPRRPGPLLGLATTAELLDELAVRLETTQNSSKGRELGSLCREAIANLSFGVLAYRTADS